ncbi:TPA: hypothetical protein ACSCYS_004562 [Aeromonas veronii]
MAKRDFYDVISSKHCACQCENPRPNLFEDRRVVGVELDNPDQPRESSRWVVYLSTCKTCDKDVTFGERFGSINLTGLDAIKEAAQKAVSRATKRWVKQIQWNKIETSINCGEE